MILGLDDRKDGDRAALAERVTQATDQCLLDRAALPRKQQLDCREVEYIEAGAVDELFVEVAIWSEEQVTERVQVFAVGVEYLRTTTPRFTAFATWSNAARAGADDLAGFSVGSFDIDVEPRHEAAILVGLGERRLRSNGQRQHRQTLAELRARLQATPRGLGSGHAARRTRGTRERPPAYRFGGTTKRSNRIDNDTLKTIESRRLRQVIAWDVNEVERRMALALREIARAMIDRSVTPRRSQRRPWS